MKFLKSFGWAMNGIRITWWEEFNFRIEIALAIVVLMFGYVLEFSPIEWIIVVGCIGAVLAAELVNTAFEDLCNKIEPKNDPIIGKVKDIMAGFVFIVCISVAIIGACLVWAHL